MLVMRQVGTGAMLFMWKWIRTEWLFWIEWRNLDRIHSVSRRQETGGGSLLFPVMIINQLMTVCGSAIIHFIESQITFGLKSIGINIWVHLRCDELATNSNDRLDPSGRNLDRIYSVSRRQETGGDRCCFRSWSSINWWLFVGPQSYIF